MGSTSMLQEGPEHTRNLQRFSVMMRQHSSDVPDFPTARHASGQISPPKGDESTTRKVRKPYIMTKQRERWEDEEHQKFLEALKLYGRAWRRIEEHIGTKTAVQIRSHAQKFFSKLEREASMGGTGAREIEIPPPRPKRKPSHPYPRKAGVTHPDMPSATGPSAGSTQLTGSQTSLKLFGQTVVVNTSQASSDSDLKQSRGTVNRETTCGDSMRKGLPRLVSQQDLKYKDGFSPYLKVIEKLSPKSSANLKAAATNLEMGYMESTNGTVEGTGESNIEDPCEGIRAFPIKVPITQLRKEETVEAKKEFSKSGATMPSMKSDVQMLEPAVYQLVENYLRHQMSAPNSTESFKNFFGNFISGPTGTTLVPWQFLQGMGINHPAAYASAIAAMSLPGFMPGTQTLMVPEQGGANAPIFLADSGATAAAAATLAAASAWWALQGVVPPEFVYPATGVMYRGTRVRDGVDVTVSAVTSSKPPVHRDVVMVEHMGNEELCMKTEAGSDVDSATSDDVTEPADARKSYCRSSTFQEHFQTHSALDGASRTKKFSSLGDTPFATSFCSNMKLSVSSSGSQKSERTDTNREELQQTPSNSTDEEDGGRERIREGSSSGSNTPLSRQSDVPNSPGSDLSGSNICPKKHHIIHGVSECNNFSLNLEDYVNGSHQILKEEQGLKEIQQNTTENTGRHDVMSNGNGCPKMRFKTLEKIEKHQYENVQLVDEEDGSRKRLKSCAYEAEKWKEVSEEGQTNSKSILSCKNLPRVFSHPCILGNVKESPGFDIELPPQSTKLIENSITLFNIEPSRESIAMPHTEGFLQDIEIQEENSRDGEEFSQEKQEMPLLSRHSETNEDIVAEQVHGYEQKIRDDVKPHSGCQQALVLSLSPSCFEGVNCNRQEFDKGQQSSMEERTPFVNKSKVGVHLDEL